MARVTIYRDNYADTTVVANCFIDDYMKDANDAQLKVYLYLLRMLSANQATSVSDIADKFNHTEKDVVRALKYWEKAGLLDLEYDAEKVLVGIHLRDLTVQNTKQGNIRLTSAAQPPVASTPVLAAQPVPASGLQGQFSPAVAVSPEDDTRVTEFVKPVYSADQLRAFKNREETAQLLFIAESYLGKPLSPSEIKSMLFFTDVLHFSEDLIDYLIQYCVDRGKKDFKYIEKVAVNWAESGITTPKQAQKASTRYDKNVYAIMNELGKSGAPTSKELEYITRWLKEYGFSMDIIFEACQRTVLATDKHRFEYADGILSSWKQADVHHKADILKMDELHQRRRSSGPRPAAANRFNQFPQNSYDFDTLERELRSN